MAVDVVPWMVGDGAAHSEVTGRVLAHVATGGRQGVTKAGDLKVSAPSTPTGKVSVVNGSASILNTYEADSNQSYTARNNGPVDVTVSPTSGTARSDMLVLRIDDPNFGGTPRADKAVGPYAMFAIISNVGSTATQAPGSVSFPCIPLARIDIPVGTSAITNAMIVDLRKTVDYVPVTEVRNVVTTTNAAGRATINYAKTFPVIPVVIPVGGNGEVYWVTSTTKTSFTVEARYHGKDILIQSGNIRVLYTATEPTS